MKKELTQEILIDILDYDKATGHLYWKTRDISYFKNQRACSTFNANKAGKRAGTTDNLGYRKIVVLGNNTSEHRVIFLYCHGYMPKIVDHINRVPDDNRIENLREATQLINSHNASMHSRNTSGITGVYWHKKAKKWQARITTPQGQLSLGLFHDIKDAEAARLQALNAYDYSDGHGTPKTP